MSLSGAGADPYSETFVPNAHGSMDHLAKMALGWDFKDQLSHVNIANGQDVFLAYDASTDAASNRLTAMSLSGAGADPYTNTFVPNAHGSMDHLASMALDWDFKEQLSHVNIANGQDVYFTYDASGQRVRKVWVHNGITEERIYLGGFEIYRRHENGGIVLERQTLHVMDGAQRIAMVETKTIDTSVPPYTPTPRIRFQCSNHLGSSNLELDEAGLVISYEEYHPYGTSAYRATNGAIDVSVKRYRYTGKERDEETGLYYHGARYYACWLGRWTSADPAGMVDGVNLFAYVRGRPMSYVDKRGFDGIRFELGGETHRPGADPKLLMDATEKMTKEISTELAQYLGIATTVKVNFDSSGGGCGCGGLVGGSSSVITSVDLKLGDDKASDAARSALRMRIESSVRANANMAYAPEGWIMAEVDNRMNKIDTLRKFVMDKLGGFGRGETVYVSTYEAHRDKSTGDVLIGFRTDDIKQVNPFTFYKSDGHGGLVKSLRGTAVGLRVMGPGMQFIHEVFHFVGLLIDGTVVSTAAAGLVKQAENQIVREVDRFIGEEHPDVGLRRRYGESYEFLPNAKFWIGKGSYTELAGNPDKNDFVQWPAKSVLTDGK